MTLLLSLGGATASMISARSANVRVRVSKELGSG